MIAGTTTTTATAAQKTDLAGELRDALVAAEFGPFYATPCAVVSPLYGALERGPGVLTVAREDNAIGIAAGAALTGHLPVVLMQNHGIGPSLGAIAALVMPYRMPMLLVVHARSVEGAPPGEAALLSRITRPLLDGLGMAVVEYDPQRPAAGQVVAARTLVSDNRTPTALLMPPETRPTATPEIPA
jgi:sulfopyruvate decarboxylase subunit alpha